MIITGYCLSMFNSLHFVYVCSHDYGGINMQGAYRRWETLCVIPRHLRLETRALVIHHWISQASWPTRFQWFSRFHV